MTVLTETKHELTKINGLEKSAAFLSQAGATLSTEAGKIIRAEEFAARISPESNIAAGLIIEGDLTLADHAGLTLRDVTVTGTLAILSPDVLIENCLLGEVHVAADDCAVRNCTVVKKIDAVDVQNLLVTLCVVPKIGLVGANNSVCLLNRTEEIMATDGRNLYICENDVHDLALVNCHYLVANGNAAGAAIKTADITNFVGNNLTDINAREACGVNHALLPQVDKDAFVYMPRKATVHEDKRRNARDYLKEEAKEKPFVILAPGVYSINKTMEFENLADGCVVYAYGVLMEKKGYETGSVFVLNCKGMTIKGMQIDHTVNSTAHGVVIGKTEGNRLRIMPCPATYPDWSDPRYYNGGTLYHYYAGHREFSRDGIGVKGGFQYDPISGEVICEISAAIWQDISVGDTVSARGKGGTGVQITGSWDTYFEDFTLYGGPGFAFNESACHSATVLHRVWDTIGPAAVIDRPTYDLYRAYEELYGVSFELSEDRDPQGKVTYRGTPPICSSVDATHTSRSKVGTACISCLFEYMCDDGTNQSAMHSRLHGCRDNGDGTVTVQFKANVSTIGVLFKWHRGSHCALFDEGERVYIYTSEGKLICDSPALSASRAAGAYTNSYGGEGMLYELEVAKKDFDLAECANFDMETDEAGARKILIDNMSRASNGFVFDNMLIRYVRSRGLLIKASNGKIRNCSFYKCGKGCISIIYEIQWGESGVSEHLDVRNNYFDSTGYIDNLPNYSPIAIAGLGTRADDEYLLYHDILFEGNVARNRGGAYAVYLNSARQVKLLHNDFGTRAGETEENPQPSVLINGAKDVELSGNIYSPYLTDITDCVEFKGNRNIYGTDAGDKLQAEPRLFAGMEKTGPILHPPVVSKENVFEYEKGAWSAGYLPIDELTYIPYPYLNGGGWFAADPIKPGENSTGGIQMKNCMYSPQPRYNVGYCYTTERTGNAHFGFETLAAGKSGSRFAIFVNGEMVWPTAGGAYTNGEDWAYFNMHTNTRKMAKELGELTFPLRAGDAVLFLGRVGDGGALFTAEPVVAWED